MIKNIYTLGSFYTLVFTILLSSFGCQQNISELGKIGETKFFAVRSENGNSPSLLALVTETKGEITVQRVAVQNGAISIVPSLIDSGGNIMAAHEFGHSLKPDQTNISGGSSTSAGGSATTGSSTSNGGNSTSAGGSSTASGGSGGTTTSNGGSSNSSTDNSKTTTSSVDNHSVDTSNSGNVNNSSNSNTNNVNNSSNNTVNVNP